MALKRKYGSRTRTTRFRRRTRRRIPRAIPTYHRGGNANRKFNICRQLNYKGVSFRKEKVAIGLRFTHLSGTSTNNAIYTHSSFVTASGPTNWAQMKELWGMYQLRGFQVKMWPVATNLEAQSQGAYQVPNIFWKYDPVDNVDWSSLDEAMQADAKTAMFRKPMSFYCKCKPQIELSTTGDVKIPVDRKRTWIPTENDAVVHRGIKFMLADMDYTSWGAGPININAIITYYYGLKMQE